MVHRTAVSREEGFDGLNLRWWCAAQKKQRRAARVERRAKELAALGGRLDPKDPFELQGKLKAELASLGKFDDALARVTAQCAEFEASVRDWAANTAEAEAWDAEEEWQEVELPTVTSEMILSIQAEVTSTTATATATGGICERCGRGCPGTPLRCRRDGALPPSTLTSTPYATLGR